MNPTIDVSYEVDGVFHTHKMRTRNERYAPGGGGINVARVFCRLGGTARCYYLSGGATSAALDGLVDLHQLVRTRIPIEHDTRIATAVLERESGKEYRFTPPGPPVAAEEWQDCLDRLAEVDCSYLVASGSLPPGVPADFYARVIKIMRERGIRTVLDTSGEALKEGLEGGGFLLVKPSLGELRQLVGRELESIEEIGEAAKAIVGKGFLTRPRTTRQQCQRNYGDSPHDLSQGQLTSLLTVLVVPVVDSGLRVVLRPSGLLTRDP